MSNWDTDSIKDVMCGVAANYCSEEFEDNVFSLYEDLVEFIREVSDLKDNISSSLDYFKEDPESSYIRSAISSVATLQQSIYNANRFLLPSFVLALRSFRDNMRIRSQTGLPDLIGLAESKLAFTNYFVFKDREIEHNIIESGYKSLDLGCLYEEEEDNEPLNICIGYMEIHLSRIKSLLLGLQSCVMLFRQLNLWKFWPVKRLGSAILEGNINHDGEIYYSVN